MEKPYAETHFHVIFKHLSLILAACVIAGMAVVLLFSGLSPARAQPGSALPGEVRSGLTSGLDVAGLSLAWVSPNVHQTKDAVAGDIDGDGDLDVVVGNSGSNNLIYINLVGAMARKFEGFEIRTLPGSSYVTLALALGDVDGDGDLDLAVTNENAPNQLLLNQGGAQGGVAGQFSAQELPGGSSWSTDAAFGDVDGDGDLDLVVTRYAYYPTKAPNWLYVNQGGAQGGQPGLLADPVDLPGLNEPGDKMSSGLALGDVDGDQDLDIVVSGRGWPGTSNRLYTNQGGTQAGVEGTFVVSELLGDHRYGEDVAMGDVDNDGDLDVVVGVYLFDPSQLYTNQGGAQGGVQGVFTVQDLPGGLSNTDSVAMGDVDSDGDLDLVMGKSYAGSTNYLFTNQGGAQNGTVGQFAVQAFPGDTVETSSLIFADIDNNNDLDLFIGNSKTNQLYLNQGGEIFGSSQSETTGYHSTSAWGDVDGDGDLDLALGTVGSGMPDQIYVNQGGKQGGVAGAFSSYDLATGAPYRKTLDLAFGDLDNDGDLDLVAAKSPSCDVGVTNECTGFENKFYVNQGSAQGGVEGDFIVSNLPGAQRVSSSVAIGDVDRDGDLDFVTGSISTTNFPRSEFYSGISQLYINQGGVQGGAPGSFSVQDLPGGDGYTSSVAFGDVDGDGDLDLAVGRGYSGSPTGLWEHNYGGPDTNLLYINQGGFQGRAAGDFIPQELPGDSNYTSAIAFGDFDADGDLDLAAVTRMPGGYSGIEHLYTNQGGLQGGSPGTFVLGNLGMRTQDSLALAIGDLDGDLDLDLVSGSSSQPTLYINQGGGQGGTAGEFTSRNLVFPAAGIIEVSLGDADSDGDLDLLTCNLDGYAGTIYLHLNHLNMRQGLPDTPPTVQIFHPEYFGSAEGYAVPQVITSTIISIPYRIADPQGEPVGSVRGFYSLNGGGTWAEAVAASGSITTNLPAPAAGAEYTYAWDTFASNFFGQSDQVVFRIEAYQATLWQGAVPAAAYSYLRSAPGSVQFASGGATSYPFRAQGTQVRVFRPDGAGISPARGALVLRKGVEQPLGVAIGSSGVPYHTDQDGYLIGSGEIDFGDTLVALWPYTTTERYTLYLTNASPTSTGLQGVEVSAPGLQSLEVTDSHPLLVFNLDVSLEWDARSDGDFLEKLEDAIQQASTVLFDVSDGQIALGDVNVYQNRENWLASDIVIYAQTGIRPRASMGGVVDTLANDVISSTLTISNAYGPGQVRMGPNWDPFGMSAAELTIDWQRALAHELSHYLLYLPDNYLGVENGQPVGTDCRGSFMTNTYDNDYSEFLIRPAWEADPECGKTIAEHTTGRVDWETVLHFYELDGLPMLHAPADLNDTNPGPALLPLDITHVSIVDPGSAAQTLPPRIFDVRQAGSGLLVSVPRAQAFVFQDQGTGDPTDDQVLPMGATQGDGDRVVVRGAAAGDRLCLFGPPDLSGQSDAGCIENLALLNTAIPVAPVLNWQPNIIARAVTSITLQVTVTLSVPTDTLHVQFFPAYGEAGGVQAALAPTATLGQVGAGVYTALLDLPAPAFEGWLRVWVPEAQPVHEAMSQLFLSPPWGPNSKGYDGGADTRAWGANSRQLGAPVASGDGQVSIFNFTDIFSDTGTLSLQAINSLPRLPSWLTQVGQGYRFLTEKEFKRAIAFDYLQSEAPPGYEYTLTIYYSPDEGANWERLPTQLDPQYNRATAIMPANAYNSRGIYALMATLEMPVLEPGWNLLAYSLPVMRSLPLALESIEDRYTSVYFNLTGNWKLFDATVVRDHAEFAGVVNDLGQLDPNRSYWIYATEVVTPYLGVASSASAAVGKALSLPPATYYGWVQPWVGFDPKVGDVVEAWIDGNLCGSSEVVALDDPKQLAYKLQVAAENGNGCGAAGRQVDFRVAGYDLFWNGRGWDNRQAWFRSLGPPDFYYYFPLILQP